MQHHTQHAMTIVWGKTPATKLACGRRNMKARHDFCVCWPQSGRGFYLPFSSLSIKGTLLTSSDAPAVSLGALDGGPSTKKNTTSQATAIVLPSRSVAARARVHAHAHMHTYRQHGQHRRCVRSKHWHTHVHTIGVRSHGCDCVRWDLETAGVWQTKRPTHSRLYECVRVCVTPQREKGDV